MTKPLIYITRKLPESFLKPYRDKYTIRMWNEEDIPVPRDVLLHETAEADAILSLLTDRLDAEVFAHASRLKMVANMAVGYDNIDVDAATENGITVTNTPDVLTETTADLTFALLMATARRLLEANDLIREDNWRHWSPYLLAGADINHRTIGIVGMGRIGEAVARRARGFGMEILYHSRTRKPEVEEALNAQQVTFDELIGQSDFVVSLVPLNEGTRHLFDRGVFRSMKQEAIFVNASRGETVDEDALYDAVYSGEIKAAGLDVFQNEPIASDHPLMQLDNVVCLPHIGSSSNQTRSEMIELCLQNISAVLEGKQPLTPVNA